MKKSKINSSISSRARVVNRVCSRATEDAIAQLKEEGKEPLPLLGVPIELPPESVLQAAREATRENIHSHSRGIPELREAIAVKLRNENQIDADSKTEIQVTNGAMHALYIVLTTLLNPGDEVLMYAPSFFYYGIIELLGGIPLYVALSEDKGFKFDIAKLEEKVTSKTKLILLNTPVNPTGYMATEDDLTGIADLAKRYNLLVVSDESYEKLVYDGGRHLSIASFPAMKERTVTIHSFTKSYALPQWRVGYIVAPKRLTEYFNKIFEWMVLCCNYVAQRVATAALTESQEWVQSICNKFEARRDLIYKGISRIDGISCLKPEAGPFIFLNISKLGVDDKDFCHYLMTKYGIPTTLGRYFQSENHLRLPFGTTKEIIGILLKRLGVAVENSRELL